jgi:hypothetical protein
MMMLLQPAARTTTPAQSKKGSQLRAAIHGTTHEKSFFQSLAALTRGGWTLELK